MDKPWKVLLVDDDEDDFIITRGVFEDMKQVSYDLEWASSGQSGLTAMTTGGYDVVLMDYSLGGVNGISVMRDAFAQGSENPVILLTGQGSREIDLKAQEAGADDYLNKRHLNADLLERSIRYCIERRRARKEREHLIAQRQEALDEVKTLHGLLPICASCKNIRDDQGYWSQIETYIEERSDAEFSHSFCPACTGNLYPELMSNRNSSEEAPVKGARNE